MKEVINLANDFVIAKEESDAKELFENLEQARHQAETCGCPSCVKHANGLDEKFTDEAWRLYGRDDFPDEEEDWIAGQAIKVLFQRKPELKDLSDDDLEPI